MSAVEHDQAQLGAYVLGVLESNERDEFEAHLATCAVCRQEVDELSELRDELGEVPPEAFLEGPPEGGDLLLQRTLREVRAQETAGLDVQPQRRPRLFAVAGAAAVIVVTLGAGIMLGRQSTSDVPSQALPPATSVTTGPPSTPVPGTRNIEGANAKTGARLVATVTPAAGWVKVRLAVQGVKEGERCKLFVVTKNGERWESGSWVVSEKAGHDGTGIDGTAAVSAADVASVEVVTVDGRKLVSASV
jgi:hypothetical protein